MNRDGYRDQIVTHDVGVSLHSKTHPCTVHEVQQWHKHSVMHITIRACFLRFFYDPYMSLFNSKHLFVDLLGLGNSLSNRSSTCREGGQLCVIISSNRVVRQYRACVVDLLGSYVWCELLYYVYNPSQSCLPSFCAVPIFHLLI